MTFLKLLRVLPAVLGVAAALAAIGTSVFGDMRFGAIPPRGSDPVARPDGTRLVEELAANKFSQLPTLTYQLRNGETLFAWQVRPKATEPQTRSRDLLILVDTSASQAGKPLMQARQIIQALAQSLAPNDRLSIWSLSTPAATRSLTKGFAAADSGDVRQAAIDLTDVEYGSGATDLKSGLNKALATLAPNPGRQQAVLLLGDGESSYNPMTEDDRIAVGARMDRDDIGFFAVPLGLKVNSYNLHGLASLTGGTVVRVQEDISNPTHSAEFATRLKATLDVPVVKVDSAKFGDEVGEVYPTKLPPLRSDKSTLVLGKLAKPAATSVTLKLNGLVSGRRVALEFTNPLPMPQTDHYFLNLMLSQWREAPHKDAPAMLQSDRALALASTQVKLYRDEFIVQATWAITLDRWEDATRLYQAAQKIDPTDNEVTAGLALIEKLKSGKVTRSDIKERISAKSDALKVTADKVAREVIQHTAAEVQPTAQSQPAPSANPQDILREAAERRRIEEQRTRVLVDTTIRRARQLLRTDPDTAYQDLKRQRDDIAAYDGIGNAARTQMVADLEAVMREIFVKGAEIKRQAEAERQAIARTRQRLNEYETQQLEEAHTKNRIDQFRQLMQQARFELAYQEAQLMVQERVAKGQTVPITATASYTIGQQATQLREWKELVRIREDRFLLTMMQAEKSHIPYPDEPPVHFPPAAVWRELTSLRREAYLNSNLGNSPPQSQIDLKNKIENDEVLIEGNITEIPLFELLQRISKQHKVTFIIMDKFFEEANVQDIGAKTPSKLKATQLRGLKLGTFLDIVLLSMDATFIVRPDYIEITTFGRRIEEKVTRVFPVADLAIPIPSSVNQRTLFQNLSIQNQSLAIFGQVLGAQNFQGFGGAFGGGQLGGGQLGGGQFGNLGGNQGNQGFRGGGLQIGGGNLGQFGNLGGQFGIQGGDQSRLLMNLIVDTVARGEWLQAQRPGQQPGEDDELPELQRKQLNSLGYYPPARALIIRGTTRYHPASSIKLKQPGDGMAAAPNNGRGGPIVIAPSGSNAPTRTKPKDPVAIKPTNKPKDDGKSKVNLLAMGPGAKPTMVDPKLDPAVLKPRLSNDPKRRWSEAIDWTVNDPGVIVASAEFLMDMNEYASAVEVLKGGLRKGLTTDAWAHESLALALQMSPQSQGNTAEYERAALSAIDLDPTDSKAYLKAAKVAAELKNHAQALAFTKRAAEFAPDQPIAYANALAYAEHSTEVKSDAVIWAAHNLLHRDWNTGDGIDYHAQTKARLEKIITRYAAAGQNTDDLKKALAEQTQRDLEIRLGWQGAADLDLIVTEPGGSICSATQKRTTGGGVLKCDQLEQGNDRSEQYTAALAFKGKYTIRVKQAFGKPIGGTAQLSIVKFKGTAKQAIDLITIDLGNPKPIEIKLDGGSRTELATVTDTGDESRAATTGAAETTGVSGFGGGFGTAGSLMSSAVATSKPQNNLPVVAQASETRLPSIGSAADLRASFKLNADRQTYSVEVNPVFSTAGKEVTLPKVPLLPGGEG